MSTSICILRLSAIGDVTHVIPVVLSIQEQIPDARITWIIGKLEAKLVGDLPGVEFVVFDKRSGLAGYRELWQTLKDRKFDALLHMQVAFRANLASACVRARKRIGYDRARSKDLHSLFINKRIKPAARQHVRDCLASFLEPLGLQPAPPVWQIPLTEQHYNFARQHLAKDRRNLVISPCASHVLRNWSADHYAELADHAIARHGMQVTLVGGPSPFEKDFCDAITRAMKETAVNLCGQDTLKELAATLKLADLVVAPDTGPAHIANAMGTDVLGLFAASNPNRSGPYNSLQWCVNRYPEALGKFTGKSVEDARWGAKAEFEGAMDLVQPAEAIAKLNQWVAASVKAPEHAGHA
ncbi:MAG: glycosyltransferase family 9 protein [Pseudomonadota bacterium]|nr:glycosyltransferase family 9 protein [Pseudomonadota bacterium]